MSRRLFSILSCLFVWLIGVIFLLGPAPWLWASDESFDSNGVAIHYSIEGKGEPVLLIHGFAANRPLQWGFPGITKALAQHYQVVAFDCRGHGLSGKPRDPDQYGTEMVEDAVRLLDRLRIKQAHIVGYSMGGFLALKLAVLHPDRVLTLVTGGAGWSAKTDHSFMDDLARSLELGKGISPLLIALTPPGRPKPTEDQLKFINNMFLAFNDARALAALVRSRKGLELNEEDLSKIKVPILAIVGSLDPFKAGVDALKTHVPQTQIIVIPRADHMNAFRKPEFIQGIEEFLSQHGHPSEVKEVRSQNCP
jgi:pimeloyl-ACP methyl ester carboxylesterase